MPATGDTADGAPLEPNDINDRLAEIAAELTAEARFTEPSAAERAKVPVRPARSRQATGPLLLRWWRNRRLAASLRKPVQTHGGPGRPPVRRSWRPGRQLRRLTVARQRRSQAGPVPDRGYATGSGHSRASSLVIVVGVLVLLLAASIGLQALLQR